MKIAIVGSGFAGLTTGKGLAKYGNAVTYIDTSVTQVKKLQDESLTTFLASQYDTITTDVTFICVPTDVKNGTVDLTQLKQAVTLFAERLAKHKQYHVIVIRSTIPPTTARKVLLPLIQDESGKKVGKDFGIVVQPEYTRKSSVAEDASRPWFILIGESDKKAGSVIEKLYSKFDAPIERVTLDEAEFQKYVHNSFNALKIAFFNEMRIVAEKEGWSADAVFHATAESSEAIWNPLYGVRDRGAFESDSLLNDTKALLTWGDTHTYKLEILRAMIDENQKHESILSVKKPVVTGVKRG